MGWIQSINQSAIDKSLGCDFVFLGGNFLRLDLFGGDALLTALASFFVFGPSSFGLIGQLLGTKRFCLLFVDVLHQDALVLEHVTLGFDVELVIEMSVDFLVLSVFLQQSPQDSHTPHPQFLDRHTGVGRTFALTGARVTALSAREGILPRACARMNSLRLLNDQTVLDQSTNVLSRVGVGDLINFIWIHPDLVGATFQHRG